MPTALPLVIHTHKYEFPSENPVAAFGAGWLIGGSSTRSTFFDVGMDLDGVIEKFNGLQDPVVSVATTAARDALVVTSADIGKRVRVANTSQYVLAAAHPVAWVSVSNTLTTAMTKEVFTREIEYTRNFGTDTVTITYPTISQASTVLIWSEGVTPAEKDAFDALSPGATKTGWTITNEVKHAVVTLTTIATNKSVGSINPRFLCGLEAIEYVRTPGALTIPNSHYDVEDFEWLPNPNQSNGTATPPRTTTPMLPPAPIASFVATPDAGTAPLTVQFTDTSTRSPTSWSWDFDDGSTSTEQHPSHTFTSAGVRTVQMTASNSSGSSFTQGQLTITTPADPYFGNVVLLAHMNGDDTAAAFFDSSAYNRNLTVATGTPTTSTLQSKFNGSSGRFPTAASSAINVPSADGNFVFTGDFTLECWSYYIPGSSSFPTILRCDFNDVGRYWLWRIAGDQYVFDANGPSSGCHVVSTGAAASTYANQWVFLTVQRANGVITMFVNGTSVASTSFNEVLGGSGTYGPLRISHTGGGEYWSGFLAEIRVTNGRARYSGNFTPPTTPFPDH